MDQPLAGIRVVDLTRILSGPFCTMMLGDLGAEVVKIETPGHGDPVREQGAMIQGMSWYFASFNRNKRSITLDLKSPDGQEILRRLIAGADVLVENFRPGVLDKMGLGAEVLAELNPRLVVGSVNGYGSTGPYSDRPAFDFITQAMSGFMSVNGSLESGPIRSAPPLTDLIAGLYTAFGILAALRVRDRDGQGQFVESSMMNGMISMMAYLSASQLATGETPPPTGNDHPVASPYGLFHALDGRVAVAPSTEPILKRFLKTIGLLHILDEERFSTNGKRIANRPELNALVNERMRHDTQENWIRKLNQAGVPCGRVQSLGEVFADPQVLHQDMVLTVDHPGHGAVKMTGFPVKLSDTPCQVNRPAPDLGADTEAVLRELGYSSGAIEGFRLAGVV